MKAKIVEAECIVTIEYKIEHNKYYSLENVIHQEYFIDFASGGDNAIQVTKLVKYKQINDYK